MNNVTRKISSLSRTSCRNSSLGDFVLSTVIVLTLSAYLALTTDYIVWSWYIPALTVASVLAFIDSAKMLRGRTSFTNPGALIGFILLPMFLVSPIKQLAWDYWPFVPNLGRSVAWVDIWAVCNLVGIIVYRFSLAHRFRIAKPHLPRESLWRARSDRGFLLFLAVALLVGVAAQGYIYARFGGVGGFIATFTERQEIGAREYDPFQGLGVPMMIADSFKMMLAIAVVHVFKDKEYAKSHIFFFSLMVFLFVVSLLFGGLRGSRSATLLSLFCAAALYHLQIRKISLKIVLIAALAGMAFISGYYWYKTLGVEGVIGGSSSQARQDLANTRGDLGRYLVARDFGRMDVQVLAFRDTGTATGPDHSLGRTYLSSVFSIVPKALIPWRPDQITKEKTELILGKGSYIPNEYRQTTLVLGQVGEAFVNFSYFGVFAFYFLLGQLVRAIRDLSESLHSSDLRIYLIPALLLVPVWLIITDMNVIAQQLVRYLLIPFVVIYFASKKLRIREETEHGNAF